MFTPVKSKKVYQLIIEQVQNMIITGELNRGDKLPSERVLSGQFNVSRASIREALRSLEILGIIESRQGEGNFVRKTTENQWLEPLSVTFKLNNGTFNEILEMRQILETEAARLASERINNDEKKLLIELMDSIRNTPHEAEKANYDRSFHQLIAEASNNLLIAAVMGSITAILRNFIKEARESINIWSQDPALLIEQHQKICDSIVDGRSEDAAAAMSGHFEMIIESRKI